MSERLGGEGHLRLTSLLADNGQVEGALMFQLSPRYVYIRVSSCLMAEQ